ncbi:hypothetical protein HF086_001662 [Spodoptera exigua]|uniref:Myeloid leukemia factor n=1 Tax=Spodoptera exigua TaxID=7107 RepID=A0A922SJQ7_SPOEX|nr:hypothetical protein HF086_001662 [Spodoptera exigua]
MSLFGSLMGDVEDDPFFGSHMRQMRQMNNMMNSLFADPFGMFGGEGPLSIMGPRHSNAMMPFMPQMPALNRLFTVATCIMFLVAPSAAARLSCPADLAESHRYSVPPAAQRLVQTASRRHARRCRTLALALRKWPLEFQYKAGNGNVRGRPAIQAARREPQRLALPAPPPAIQVPK